jgi:heparanase 1
MTSTWTYSATQPTGASEPIQDTSGLLLRAVGFLILLQAPLSGAQVSHLQVGQLVPATMARIGTIDQRYQSFNVEMLEVTGGDFWKPYASLDAGSKTKPDPGRAGSGVPAGMSPDLYQYRPPIDLSNARLRKLAAALGPSYVRVSGTWANTTYFHDSDTPAPKVPPAGFGGVLTRPQWKGVIDFAHAIDAKLVSSFATGVGVRDAAGVWTPVEATKVLQYTQSIGGSIAAAEFMNEPTMAAMGGAPKGYDGTSYGRDLAVFVPFVKSRAPEMIVLGPGSVGEGGSFSPTTVGLLKSEDLLAAAGPVFDAFSYHYYGGASERCASSMPGAGTTAAVALSQQWLAGTDQVEMFYAKLRDRFEPSRPMWITETADTACGGNRWASTFLDTFRYVDQLGRLAQRGLQVVIHNTLASSDYGLLDESTYAPRPNYWAALLWRRLMGLTVLDPGPSPSSKLHLYAHCLRGEPGGVAVLAINTDRTSPVSITIPAEGRRYTLTAKRLEDKRVQLNLQQLRLGADDALPPLNGLRTRAGKTTFAPASITFITLPGAGNGSCS